VIPYSPKGNNICKILLYINVQKNIVSKKTCKHIFPNNDIIKLINELIKFEKKIEKIRK